MNPAEIQTDIRNLETMVPPSSLSMTFSPPPVAKPTMETLGKFLALLNERFPIDRGISNFHGNHHVVLDTTGLSRPIPGITVGIWIWQQLDWRSYQIALTDEDLLLTPEALVEEVARVITPELSKLIVPAAKIPPAQS
jgi:hypothetical protein